MESIKITIEVDPIPQSRPRFSGGHAYQPKRNRDYRDEVQRAAVAAMYGHEPFAGEICANVKLFRRFKPTARNFGDVDNHAKAILDGLNGICFADDSQVVRLTVEKFKDSNRPRAEVELTCTVVKS